MRGPSDSSIGWVKLVIAALDGLNSMLWWRMGWHHLCTKCIKLYTQLLNKKHQQHRRVYGKLVNDLTKELLNITKVLLCCRSLGRLLEKVLFFHDDKIRRVQLSNFGICHWHRNDTYFSFVISAMSGYSQGQYCLKRVKEIFMSRKGNNRMREVFLSSNEFKWFALIL